MVRAVTRAAGVDERDVGYAGLKDKHAVTRQWLSLPAKARAPSEWKLPEGITVVDGQQLTSDARVIKTQDEISLLNTSAMMVDAAYDELYRAMKPGLRENEAAKGPARPASPEDDPFVREIVRRFDGRVTRVKEVSE